MPANTQTLNAWQNDGMAEWPLPLNTNIKNTKYKYQAQWIIGYKYEGQWILMAKPMNTNINGNAYRYQGQWIQISKTMNPNIQDYESKYQIQWTDNDNCEI